MKLCVPAFAGMVAMMRVSAEEKHKDPGGGFMNTADLADYLVTKGVPFCQAHEITGKPMHYCVQQRSHLEELGLEVLREH